MSNKRLNKSKIKEFIEYIFIFKTIKQRVPQGKFKGGFDYESYRKNRLLLMKK